jgi:competence protein ComEC
MEKKNITIIGICFLVIFCIGVFILQKELRDRENKAEEAPLRVTFLDVGKADCILIEVDGITMMIDAGYDENGDDICKFLEERGITRLNYLVLTHSDKDHIGGADKVLEKIEVEEVIESYNIVDTKDYKEYRQIIQEKGIKSVQPENLYYMAGTLARIVVFPSEKTMYKQDNDYSLVVKLTYGADSLLFAGDSENVRLKELLKEEQIKSNVLKLPHHGIGEDSTEEFIRKVSPRIVIVTCEDKKMLDESTRILLQEMGCEIYYTADGNITYSSDGKRIKVKQ